MCHLSLLETSMITGLQSGVSEGERFVCPRVLPIRHIGYIRYRTESTLVDPSFCSSSNSDYCGESMSNSKANHSAQATAKHIRSLAQLITAKTATLQSQDGRVQIGLAIAAVSSLVTIDASTIPPTSIPANLFTLTFDDKSVGISGDQMPAFYANLALLLPTIVADIQQLETTTDDNPSLPIEQVAQFVRLSLVPSQSES